MVQQCTIGVGKANVSSKGAVALTYNLWLVKLAFKTGDWSADAYVVWANTASVQLPTAMN
jgi:hypothetical protein